MTNRLIVLWCCGILTLSPVLAYASSPNEGEVSSRTEGFGVRSNESAGGELEAQVKNKEQRIRELDGMISAYRGKIAEQEQAASSLQNQIALLDNRIQERQLARERTKQQIERAALEIQRLNELLKVQTAAIKQRTLIVAALLRQVAQADQVSSLEALLARPSLSEFFVRVEEVKRLQARAVEATRQLKAKKQQAEVQKKSAEDQRQTLETYRKALLVEERSLDADRQAKISLVSQTQNREDEFQRILYELHQTQQGETDEFTRLQEKLKGVIDESDTALARGDVLFNWPVPVTRGISAAFHDPDYPFRKFFEHPGVDVPTPVGTPVKAAAGGYVAWNRTGKQYGNYVMLVHPGGLATVYAHLSAFAAKPDTYVERGEIIGYSGGRPGDQGAGLSTGAHVHFEVRQNGIPVDPQPFLPEAE